MSNELKFASEKEALQYLSDVTGKRIKIAMFWGFGLVSLMFNGLAKSIKNMNYEAAEEIVEHLRKNSDLAKLLVKETNILELAQQSGNQEMINLIQSIA